MTLHFIVVIKCERKKKKLHSKQKQKLESKKSNLFNYACLCNDFKL